MNELFLILAIVLIASAVMVISLTGIVLMLLNNIRKLEDELEANLPPF
jgi:Tfp pilus assembly protein PilV